MFRTNVGARSFCIMLKIGACGGQEAVIGHSQPLVAVRRQPPATGTPRPHYSLPVRAPILKQKPTEPSAHAICICWGL
eukprot:2888867-Pyramimonas_sp.AAC.1